MASEIYVHDSTRRFYKQQIESFSSIMLERVFLVFDNIEDDARCLAENYYQTALMQAGIEDYVDLAELSEEAIIKASEYYWALSLARYNTIGMAIVTLCQMWEQQLRLFLYREMSHYERTPFEDFCTDFGEIRKCLKAHGIEVEKLQCWPRIKELRLLCNVVKHSDGESAKRLADANPELFRCIDKERYISIRRTTLLDETLEISPELFRHYVEAVKSFWDELPERSSSE